MAFYQSPEDAVFKFVNEHFGRAKQFLISKLPMTNPSSMNCVKTIHLALKRVDGSEVECEIE